MAGGLPYRYIDSVLHERRERVFLVLAGLFLGSMAMLNILGVSRFIAIASISDGGWSWGAFGEVSFAVAIGVLPYPATFLCTDLISELYGRRRANIVVWVGLLLNLWVLFFLWVGGVMPPAPDLSQGGLPQAPVWDAAAQTWSDDGSWAFYRIRMLTMGSVVASMFAYLAAQFCDVYLFHFWKHVTRGRHLWLRNNGSTLVSQFIDTFAVITITHFYADGLAGVVDKAEPIWPQLWLLIGSGYAFKVVAALLDTIPFYLGVAWLSRYLSIDPIREHDADAEETVAIE